MRQPSSGRILQGLPLINTFFEWNKYIIYYIEIPKLIKFDYIRKFLYNYIIKININFKEELKYEI